MEKLEYIIRGDKNQIENVLMCKITEQHYILQINTKLKYYYTKEIIGFNEIGLKLWQNDEDQFSVLICDKEFYKNFMVIGVIESGHQYQIHFIGNYKFNSNVELKLKDIGHRNPIKNT
ncbi:MAG: hypothetical protein ACOC3V_04465 [bacterium]